MIKREPPELAAALARAYKDAHCAGRWVAFRYKSGRVGAGRVLDHRLYTSARRVRIAVRGADGSSKIIVRKVDRDSVQWLNSVDPLAAKQEFFLSRELEHAQSLIPG